MAQVSQYTDRFCSKWTVAWNRMDLFDMGNSSWIVSGDRLSSDACKEFPCEYI